MIWVHFGDKMRGSSKLTIEPVRGQYSESTPSIDAHYVLSIDDEACFVDGEHLAAQHGADQKRNAAQDGPKRINFLSLLPPELSLCIVFLLDEHTDALTAMATSMAMVWNNLVPMITWGAIVLALFAVSVGTGLVALIVVFPLLGHATWHAYKAIR